LLCCDFSFTHPHRNYIPETHEEEEKEKEEEEDTNKKRDFLLWRE